MFLSCEETNKNVKQEQRQQTFLRIIGHSIEGVEHWGDLQRDRHPETQMGSFRQSFWKKHRLRSIFYELLEVEENRLASEKLPGAWP